MDENKLNVTFLSHEGVKGMHWGERRYQYKDGSLTPLGRIHWGIGQARKKVKVDWKKKQAENKKKKEERAVKKAEKAKLKQEKDAEALAKKKEDILRRSKASEIYKNRSLFSDDELDRAISRMGKLETIKSKDPKEKKAVENLQKTKENRQTVKDGKSTVEKLTAAGKTLTGAVGVAVGLYEGYNKIANIVNEVSGENKMKTFNMQPWKTGDDSDKGDSKKDNKKDNKKYNLDTSFDYDQTVYGSNIKTVSSGPTSGYGTIGDVGTAKIDRDATGISGISTVSNNTWKTNIYDLEADYNSMPYALSTKGLKTYETPAIGDVIGPATWNTSLEDLYTY